MSGIMEQLESLDDSVKLLICLVGIVFSLFLSRFLIVKPWLRLVKLTSAEWDDQLHAPISNRLYAFILIGGLGLGRLIGAQALIQSLPPIHDVQTDWDDPIMPSEALLKARGEGSNPIQEDPVIPPFLAQMEQGFEAERAAAQESCPSPAPAPPPPAPPPPAAGLGCFRQRPPPVP